MRLATTCHRGRSVRQSVLAGMADIVLYVSSAVVVTSQFAILLLHVTESSCKGHRLWRAS
jgi:hypothetical protein